MSLYQDAINDAYKERIAEVFNALCVRLGEKSDPKENIIVDPAVTEARFREGIAVADHAYDIASRQKRDPK